MLFSVCSAVTVECCVLYTWVCLLLCNLRKKALLQCLCNSERRDIGLYEVPLFGSLLGFGIGTMLANIHV